MTVAIEDDKYAALAARVEYPEPWRPEPGDTLVGEAIQWETVTLREGDKDCQVLTLRDSAGKEWAVWTWHAVLQGELIGKVAVGDLVALHFQGKRSRQDGGGEYAAYRVAVETSTEKPEGDGDGIPF